jgi:hypothetical protein
LKGTASSCRTTITSKRPTLGSVRQRSRRRFGHRKRGLQKHGHLKNGKIKHPQRDGRTRGRRGDGKIKTFLREWLLKERSRRDGLRIDGCPPGRQQSCGRKIKKRKRDGLKPECPKIWSLRTDGLKKAVYRRGILPTDGPKIEKLQKGGKTGRRLKDGWTERFRVDGKTENPSPHGPETDGQTGSRPAEGRRAERLLACGKTGRRRADWRINGHPKDGWTKVPRKHGETGRFRQDRPKTDGPETNRRRPGWLRKPLFPRARPKADPSHSMG